MTNFKKLLLLLLAVCVLLPFSTQPVQAAEKPKLNKTTVNMSTADTVTLKVLNTKKKVTWSSSNKAVARVNANGKVTPSWFGKTVISAKVGGKTLKCTVNVLEEDFWSSSDEPGYYLCVMPLSEKKARVQLMVSDGDETYSSGSLTAEYHDDGSLHFINQGKYNISGGLETLEYGDEFYCVLVVLESDDDIFLTDTLIFDNVTENS